MLCRFSGNGRSAFVCSSVSEAAGNSFSAPGTACDLSAITACMICCHCCWSRRNGQAMIGKRSSTSLRCENFAGMVCNVAPIGPGLAGAAGAVPVVTGAVGAPLLAPTEIVPCSGAISAARASSGDGIGGSSLVEGTAGAVPRLIWPLLGTKPALKRAGNGQGNGPGSCEPPSVAQNQRPNRRRSCMNSACRTRINAPRSGRADFGRFERLVGGDCLARQRIIGAFVQPADAVAVEALFLDLEIGAEQKLGRQFLDGEADRLGRGRKTLVADRAPRLAAPARKKFGRGPVVDHRHNSLLAR